MTSPMKAIHVERLQQVADALRQPKLPMTNRWDFRSTYYEMDCYTAGCAIAQMPALFPNTFMICGQRVCIRDKDGCWLMWYEEMYFEEFFGLRPLEVSWLFDPTGIEEWDTTFAGRSKLREDATQEQVADNLDAFIAWKLETVEVLRTEVAQLEGIKKARAEFEAQCGILAMEADTPLMVG